MGIGTFNSVERQFCSNNHLKILINLLRATEFTKASVHNFLLTHTLLILTVDYCASQLLTQHRFYRYKKNVRGKIHSNFCVMQPSYSEWQLPLSAFNPTAAVSSLLKFVWQPSQIDSQPISFYIVNKLVLSFFNGFSNSLYCSRTSLVGGEPSGLVSRKFFFLGKLEFRRDGS